MALKADRVVTQQQLLRAIWGPNHQEHTHYLRIYIGQLRHKIEADRLNPDIFLPKRGLGIVW